VQTIFYIALFSGFVPLLLVGWQNRHGRMHAAIIPFVVLVFAASMYEWIFTNILRVNTLVWFRVYILLEYLCLLYYFTKIVPSAKLFGAGFSILFLTAFMLSVVYWDDSSSYKGDGYLSVLQTIFTYIFAFLWFKDIFKNLELTSLWNSPDFYFISAFVLYYSATIFLFILADIMVKQDKGQFVHYWSINIVSVLVLRLLLTFGIWKGHQKSIPYSGPAHS
jgi:hypothetical protein